MLSRTAITVTAMDRFLAPSSFYFCFFMFLASVNIVVSDHNSMLYQNGLKNYNQLDLPGVVGPESIAFDCKGRGPYVSVSDGRILLWKSKVGWTEFAVPSPHRNRKVCDGSTNPKLEPLCGRPLGIKFNPGTCDLYIADAYYGLLVVGPNGGVAKKLANSAEGVPFRFTNALDIDPSTGLVYFTDSSAHYQRRNYLFAVINADKSGRLLQYNPRTKKVTVLCKGLSLPNGVTLSKDNTFLLLAEVSNMRILKFALPSSSSSQGSHQYVPELFADLGRFPDNIKRNANGDFWVALNTGRGKIQRLDKETLSHELATWWFLNDPVAAKLGKDGEVVEFLDGESGNTLESVSEVEENNGTLWIGSSMKPYHRKVGLGCWVWGGAVGFGLRWVGDGICCSFRHAFVGVGKWK